MGHFSVIQAVKILTRNVKIQKLNSIENVLKTWHKGLASIIFPFEDYIV